MADNPNDRYRSAAELAAAAQLALTAAPYRGGPSTKPTSPDPPLPGPSDGVTQTIQLPHAPATANPAPARFDPVQGRSPTVSYPHSRPVPLAVRRSADGDVISRRRSPSSPSSSQWWLAPSPSPDSSAIGRPAHPQPPARHGTPTPGNPPMCLPWSGHSEEPDHRRRRQRLRPLEPDSPQDANPFDSLPSKLMKLAAGATKTTMLEFPGLDFRSATDLAVDAAGKIYFSDGSQVWELPAGARSRSGCRSGDSSRSTPSRSTQPATCTRPARCSATSSGTASRSWPRRQQADRFGLPEPVSAARNSGQSRRRRLYLLVHRGSRRRPGPPTPGRLHHGQQTTFPGLLDPRRVAVDTAGSVFVADTIVQEFSSCRPDWATR